MKVLRLTLVRHTFWAVAILIALLALSNVLSPYRDLQLSQVAYLTCAAAGLTVLTGMAGQISLGHGAFMAIGAYTTALLLNHRQWPLAAVLVAAVVVTALAGLIVGVAAARLEGPYLAGATLALAVGLPGLANFNSQAVVEPIGRLALAVGLTGPAEWLADAKPLAELLGGENGLSIAPIPAPLALGEEFPLERWNAWVCCLGAVIVMWLLANLTRGRLGRSLPATRDDEVAAELSGIRVARVRVIASVIAAACAGLGGGLMAVVVSLAAPGAFPFTLSLQLIAAVVLGGLGSLAGAVWGSMILVLVPTVAHDLATSADLSHNITSNLPIAIFGVVLIVVILLFPRGLQGGLRSLKDRFTRRLPAIRPRRVPTQT